MPEDVCPCCATPLVANSCTCRGCGIALSRDDGSPIGKIDCLYPHLVARNQRRFIRMMWIATPVAGVALALSAIVTGPLHILLAAPVVTAVHVATLWWLFLPRVGGVLSPRRRFVARVTRRLMFYPLAYVGYAAAVVPVAGLFIGGAVAAGLTAGVHFHTVRVLRLEYDREALTPAEKVLFFTSLGCALSLLVGIILLIASGAVVSG